MKFADLEEAQEVINAYPYAAEAVDDWVPATLAGGDCDSYATAKFDWLVRIKGWPHTALRLALCYVEPFKIDGVEVPRSDRYHAVLLADLDGQTWVLDNRHPHPMEYQLLPYEWHVLQVAGTRQWEQAA